MSKRSYSEELKDPRWQKKRLEVLQRDGFQCQNCGDTQSELNVHHVYYDPDFKVWEYPDEAYMTLCKTCHYRWHYLKKGIDKMFCQLPIDSLTKVYGILVCLRNLGPETIVLFHKLINGYNWINSKKDLDF